MDFQNAYGWVQLEQRKKLASFADSSQSVHLINCEIKQSCEGDKMKKIVKKFTESPRGIDYYY